MNKIKEAFFNFIKGDNLVGHLSGYVESRVSLLKLEFAEDVAKELSKGISKGLFYAILFILAGSFLFFFSIGVAIYINTFFDRPYLGYWIVSGLYLLVFLVTLVAKKSVQRKIKQRIIEMVE